MTSRSGHFIATIIEVQYETIYTHLSLPSAETQPENVKNIPAEQSPAAAHFSDSQLHVPQGCFGQYL